MFRMRSAVFAFFVPLTILGCGDSQDEVLTEESGFVSASTRASPEPETPSGNPTETGGIQIQLALQNNRSVKSGVRSFLSLCVRATCL